jgi:hypothetical protein
MEGMFPDRFHDLLVDANHLEAGQYRFDQVAAIALPLCST